MVGPGKMPSYVHMFVHGPGKIWMHASSMLIVGLCDVMTGGMLRGLLNGAGVGPGLGVGVSVPPPAMTLAPDVLEGPAALVSQALMVTSASAGSRTAANGVRRARS